MNLEKTAAQIQIEETLRRGGFEDFIKGFFEGFFLEPAAEPDPIILKFFNIHPSKIIQTRAESIGQKAGYVSNFVALSFFTALALYNPN